MAITINGTTGISGVDGSASTPALQGTDTNTGISFGTDEVEINTGGVERVKVDSSGKFGIGQTSPNALLEVNSDTDGQEVARFEGDYAASGDVTLANFRRDGGAVAAAVQYHDSLTAMSIGSTTAHAFTFRTSDTERMRITGTGNLVIGSTSTVAGAKIGLTFNGQTNNGIGLQTTYSSTGTDYIRFNNSAGNQAGEIQQTGTTAVSYITSSDYRLKENVASLNDGIERVKRLLPYRFSWIADSLDAADQDGFFAHEVQEVVPIAVGKTQKDAVDDDGNPVYQGIDHSKLVPLLTAALQEAIAKIETLEAKVAVLEGGAS